MAERTPISGPDALVQGWGDYDSRSLVIVLGGTQPDSSYRIKVNSTQFIRDGTDLVVFGKIARTEGAATGAIAMPWVVLSVDAGAADVVSRCILSLKGTTPFTSGCP